MTYETAFGTVEAENPFTDGDVTCAGCGCDSVDALCDDCFDGHWTLIAPDLVDFSSPTIPLAA